MATKEYQDKQDQMGRLLFEVIKMAGEPENQGALGGLKHMILGDAGTALAVQLEKAGVKMSDGTKYVVTSPESAYSEKCKAMQPREVDL
ncbi:MAG: hypothetical protein FWC00_05170 [Firmicutes bacterium]|nr:hypothetical protein [Bacillota bacterium]